MERKEGEIVLYQPDETIQLEVKLDVEQDTVWLSQQQIAVLFGVQKAAISKHMKNIFSAGELNRNRVVSKMETTAVDGKRYMVEYYNLDMRMTAIEGVQAKQQEQLDFFIRTSTPPAEMVFFNGQFFTARVAVESLIKMAKRRVVVIDHYVDAKTFEMFDVREKDVEGIIYTQGVGAGMTRLRDEHNRQPGVQPVEVKKWRVEPHDRFLVIDDQLYHCGHSLNATGSKLSCIMLMGTFPEVILNEME